MNKGNTDKMGIEVSPFHLGVDDDAVIPATAIPVNVTNIINPYLIRLHGTDQYAERLTRVGKKLHHLMRRKGKLKGDKRTELQPDDIVTVDCRSTYLTDIPASWCRGIVESFHPANSKYGVFLVDHGIMVETFLDELTILPKDSIPDKCLTSTIGVYNIVPLTMEDNGDANTTVSISEQWTDTAIQFTREMVAASRETYFECLATESGYEYGELYLVIDDEVVVLSESLVLNHFATYLEGELLQLIENPAYDFEGNSKMVNGHTSIGKGTKHQNGPVANSKQCNGYNEKHSVTSGLRCNGKTDERLEMKNDSKDRKRPERNTAVSTYALTEKLDSTNRREKGLKILIHSVISCTHLIAVCEARFPLMIHKALETMKVIALRRIQSYFWPAVSKGLNAVAIAPSKSGKTYGYVIPIVSQIAMNELYSKMPKGNGPLALILCASSSDVDRVYNICRDLLQYYPHIKTLAAYNGMPEDNLVINLYNGCHILISTPRYLARVMKNNKKVFNFKRLCHFVLDGADVILDNYHPALAELVATHKVLGNREHHIPGAPLLQLIAVAETWTHDLRKFVSTTMDKPYICIGSYIEAAVFADVQLKVCIIPKDLKFEKLSGMLNTTQPMLRTMIVCSGTEEAEKLYRFLAPRVLYPLVAHGQMDLFQIQGVKESWAASVSGKHPLLICTDEVLSDLNITDVQWLIHSSLPEKSKSKFHFRFSAIMDNYPQVVNKKEKTDCKVVIMLDNNNDHQLSGIITLMQRLKLKIPDNLLTHFNKVLLTVDTKKADRPLCEDVKAFGSCRKKSSCMYRHSFLPGVKPMTSIENGDSVTLIINCEHTATHYSARIVEYTSKSTKKRISFPFQEFAELPLKMNLYYSNKNNRRSTKIVKVGDVYTYEDIIDCFKRVRILSIEHKDDSDIPKIVKVWTIDSGDLLTVHVSQLLEIPEELAKWPSHVVEVYLAGVAPFDDESRWSPCADEAVRSWFEANLNASKRSFVYGKVALHHGYTLWVDPLEIRTKVEGYPDLVNASLKSLLIKEKHGMENTTHLDRLLELSRNCR